jgi:hypothetical protein
MTFYVHFRTFYNRESVSVSLEKTRHEFVPRIDKLNIISNFTGFKKIMCL